MWEKCLYLGGIRNIEIILLMVVVIYHLVKYQNIFDFKLNLYLRLFFTIAVLINFIDNFPQLPTLLLKIFAQLFISIIIICLLLTCS